MKKSRVGRREFCRRLVVGAVAGVVAPGIVGGRLCGADGPVNPYEEVALGRTGLRVSRIGMGTGMRGWMRESNQTRLGREALEALLRGAWERGVRFFDMADLYGTHGYVASAFTKIPRERYVLCTKIWNHPQGIPEPERPDAATVVERFRKELRTDVLDIVQLHCMSSGTWPESEKRHMDLLADLKAKGVIRAHGVSCHSLAALEAAAGSPWVDVVHARINAFGEKMDGAVEKVASVLRRLHEGGKGVVGIKLVGEGRFRDEPAKRSESVRYVVGLGCVATMIVGFERVEEIDDFAESVRAALQDRARA